MKVKGKRTTVENVDVEVDILNVLGQIYSAWLPKGMDHVSKGNWYREDGFNYHTRDECYAQDRPVTEEEQKFIDSYRTIIEFVKNKGL
jgi:hypothetical protein